jgi:N-acyl-phosphatidylethanolamine-hydrolysing phospholipase D
VIVSPIPDFPWKARKIKARFVNLSDCWQPRLWDIIRWRLSRIALNSRFSPPVRQPDFDAIRSPDPSRITVTWIGHSCFLIQVGERNFLTDPHFSAYCSPVPSHAFLRQSAVGLTVEHLPKIDAVLISHCHYDHLDFKSLRSVQRQNAGVGSLTVICPSGLGSLLERWGIPAVTEMSWGDAGNFNNETDATDLEDGSIRITCLPAQHGAARTPFDSNKTLWCGWLLESRGRKIAFLGDTGYAPFFAGLGERFGPLDLTFIPIGAYQPRWIMQPLHMDPEEAVLVHSELRSKRSIAMHWGTFVLADDPLSEAPRLLKAARSAAGLTQEEFSLPRLGETIFV